MHAEKSKDAFRWGAFGFIVVFHVLAAMALLNPDATAIAIALSLHVLTIWIGHGIGYHRLMTHRSFKTHSWVERLLAFLGTLALQGAVLGWVGTHAYHHAHADTEKDPPSPRHGGFWHSHLLWFLKGDALAKFRHKAPRRYRDDPYYQFLDKRGFAMQVVLTTLLYLWGGWNFVLWGTCFRIVLGWHAGWSINSITHMWGKRPYDTPDFSRNNLLSVILTGGEGWHNNHHYDQHAANQGNTAWSFEPNWWMIRGLEKLGLAWDIKTRPYLENDKANKAA